MSLKYVLPVFAGLLTCACSSTSDSIPNVRGVQTVQFDPGTKGPIAGIGIEGQDIVSMADQMVRDMMANPLIAGRTPTPRVIIDAEFFNNESAQRINKNIIIDNLRNGLVRSANGRIRFVSRESAAMVDSERNLKRDGVTDTGTTGLARAVLGADFRLRGRITSTDQVQASQGLIQRYNQITFEMVDLETQEIVWGGMYNFARAGADDVIYR